jgi:hypothetical protein
MPDPHILLTVTLGTLLPKGKPGAQRRLPGRRLPLRPAGQHAAHNHFIDLIRTQARTLSASLTAVAPERRRRHLGKCTLEAAHRCSGAEAMTIGSADMDFGLVKPRDHKHSPNSRAKSTCDR